jgi:hypothetical protein
MILIVWIVLIIGLSVAKCINSLFTQGGVLITLVSLTLYVFLPLLAFW